MLIYKHHHQTRNILENYIVIEGFKQVQDYNQREETFGRQGLLVKVCLFKTVVGVRVVPRGTRDHWVNPLQFFQCLHVGYSFKEVY